MGRHVFELLNEKGLQGAIIFLSRDFGGIHLGRDRFTLINKVVKQAMAKYNAAMKRNPKLLKPERLQINLDEEWVLQGMGPTREPKPANATNLAEQNVKRLMTLQMGEQAQNKYTNEQLDTEVQGDEMEGEGLQEGNMQDSEHTSAQTDMTRHKDNYIGPPLHPQGPPTPVQHPKGPSGPRLPPPQIPSQSQGSVPTQYPWKGTTGTLAPLPLQNAFSPRSFPPLPPPKQLVSGATAAYTETSSTPVVIGSQTEKDSVTLPTTSKENKIQTLMIVKPAKAESNKSKRKKRQANRKVKTGSMLKMDALSIQSPKIKTIQADNNSCKAKQSPKSKAQPDDNKDKNMQQS